MSSVKEKRQYYIACDDWNFSWTSGELESFNLLWREGKPIWEIARQIRRPIKEVAILIMDLAERRVIEERTRGVFGENLNGNL